MPDEAIESVLQKHTRRLMSLPGVVGIAQGECEGKLCIKVYVARKTARLLRQLPPDLDGYLVNVEESGKFQALGT